MWAEGPDPLDKHLSTLFHLIFNNSVSFVIYKWGYWGPERLICLRLQVNGRVWIWTSKPLIVSKLGLGTAFPKLLLRNEGVGWNLGPDLPSCSEYP